MDQYQTVFDLAQSGYKTWPFPALGLIFVMIGAVMVFFPAFFNSFSWGFIKGQGRRVFSWFFLLFSIAWTTLAFLSTYGEYSTLRDRLDRRTVEVVQGNVENFQADAKRESFDVSGTHFEYSYYTASNAFNTPSTHGGPLRAGLRVRITHVEGKIVRLEILRTNPPSA